MLARPRPAPPPVAPRAQPTGSISTAGWSLGPEEPCHGTPRHAAGADRQQRTPSPLTLSERRQAPSAMQTSGRGGRRCSLHPMHNHVLDHSSVSPTPHTLQQSKCRSPLMNAIYHNSGSPPPRPPAAPAAATPATHYQRCIASSRCCSAGAVAASHSSLKTSMRTCSPSDHTSRKGAGPPPSQLHRRVAD